MTQKLKCLVYSDAPTAPTGFGTVIRNIFLPLVEEHYFETVSFYGVNYFGDPHDLPVSIWPAQIAGSRDGDMHGRGRFAEALLRPGNWDFDVLFFLLDHFTLAWPIVFPDGRLEPFLPGLLRRLREMVKAGQRRPFKTIQYIPIDSDTVRPEWLMWMPELIDKPVAYTSWGRNVILDLVPSLEAKLQVIPHGTSPDVFRPLDPAYVAKKRQDSLGLGPNDPLIININRNQPRKDVPRTLQLFKHLLEECPTAKLYLHMNVRDSMGYDLEVLRLHLRIPNGKVAYPANFSEGRGVSLDELNVLYNMGDVFVTTARGEGWGLSCTESQCAGIPVVAPDHTSFSEILAHGRGVLVPPMENREVLRDDNDQLRPVANAEAMADAVMRLLASKRSIPSTYYDGVRLSALRWAQSLSWREHVVPLWRAIFDECSRELYGEAAPAMKRSNRRFASAEATT